MQDITTFPGPCPVTVVLRMVGGVTWWHIITLVCRTPLVAAQVTQLAPGAPGYGNILHFPIRACGAGPGPGQQLAGLVGAAPALTGRSMILIWRSGALAIVLEHVVGQECLIPLQNHSMTRVHCVSRVSREASQKQLQ